METDSFIVHTKADDIYKYISEKDLTLQILKQTDRYLKEENKKVTGLTKDELNGKIMKEFAGLRAKTYSNLKDNNHDDKKGKGTKKCNLKRKIKFQVYKNCLGEAKNKLFKKKRKLVQIVLKKIKKNLQKNNKVISKTQKRFKREGILFY